MGQCPSVKYMYVILPNQNTATFQSLLQALSGVESLAQKELLYFMRIYVCKACVYKFKDEIGVFWVLGNVIKLIQPSQHDELWCTTCSL